MADRARNQHGLGKAVTFNVITPMPRLGTWVVGFVLWFFDREAFLAVDRLAGNLTLVRLGKGLELLVIVADFGFGNRFTRHVFPAFRSRMAIIPRKS